MKKMRIHFSEIDQYFVIIVFCLYAIRSKSQSLYGSCATWQFIIEGINLVSNGLVSDGVSVW